MNVPNLYKKIKQILSDSNTALVGKGLNEVNSLSDVLFEIEKNEINRLPYLLRREIYEITEDDLNSCTSIRDFTFYDCSNLANIAIPDNVIHIGSNAFRKTAYYNNVDNWEDNVLYIDKCLIEAKAPISGNYNINSGTRVIADEAFYGLSNLTGVTMPNSVITIGNAAFSGCNNLANIDISDSATSIGKNAFYNCTGLTSVTIPDNITSIGDSVFNRCTNLKNIVINSNEMTLGNNVFTNCSNIETIYVKNIESWLAINFTISSGSPLRSSPNAMLYFNNQPAIDITIPNNITNIKNYAFYKYSALVSVIIPDSVTSIGIGAFSECTNLTDIYLHSVIPPVLNSSNAFPNSTIFHVPIGSKEVYKSATNWSRIASRIVEDIVIE